MRDYILGGTATLVILALVTLEGLALALLRARRGLRPLVPADVAGNLLAGAMMLLAVHAALRGADYRVIALFLAASLPPHVVALARRSPPLL